jgi:hypothetical protein
MKLREEVSTRQQTVIAKLKDELTNAKNILANPRLKAKILEKIGTIRPDMEAIATFDSGRLNKTISMGLDSQS